MIRDRESFSALLATVRRFAQEECLPLEGQVDAGDEIPEPVVERMRALGLFGHSIPEAFGGAGLTTEELTLVNLEVSQVATAFRARFGGNTGIASESLVVDGTPEQQRRYLPRLASGELTGCFALTEPEAGSDATAQKTVAVRDGDSFVISGHKCFITNAPIADLFTVFARTDPQAKGAAGISAFLVERGAPGLSTSQPYRKMGQHGSPVGEVVLERVSVPASAIVGGGGAGIPHCDEDAEQAAHQPGRAVHRTGDSPGGRDGAAGAGAPPVRPADRRVPAGAADDRREQHRGARRACAGAGDRAQAGRRHRRDDGSLDVQALRFRDVRARRGPRGAGVRRQRLHRRQRGRALLPRRAAVPPLRGTSQIHLVNIARRTLALAAKDAAAA